MLAQENRCMLPRFHRKYHAKMVQSQKKTYVLTVRGEQYTGKITVLTVSGEHLHTIWQNNEHCMEA